MCCRSWTRRTEGGPRRRLLGGVAGVALAVWVGAGIGCAPTASDEAPTVPVGRGVYLLATELLDAPATGHDAIYKATYQDEAGAAGFYLSVACADPDTLQVQLTRAETGEVMRLQRVVPPADAAADGPAAFDDQTLGLRNRGRGFYWVETLPGGSSLEARVAVVLPAVVRDWQLGIELFTDLYSDGTLVSPARLELVDDFFYLAVIGDSVMWGNGLRTEDKIWYRVARAIEAETGRRVITQVYAQSGADIVPGDYDAACEVNCFGEVPSAPTSITLQTQLIERPELLDLVLMNGCINDVGVSAIIDPSLPEQELIDETTLFCEQEMEGLLARVVDLAPQAAIVVMGYYPIVGPESDLFGLRNWGDARGLDLDTQGAQVVEKLTARSEVFVSVAHTSLSAAVEAANAVHPQGERLAFASPRFGPENAVFAPDRWLFSLVADTDLADLLDIDLELFPEDPMFNFRVSRCFADDLAVSLIECLYASIAHPNPEGAAAYASSVEGRLRALGVLPK